MPTIPCPTKIDCQPCQDEPILNVSAEQSDVDRYVSRFSFLNAIPPIRQYPDFDEQGGGIFLQVGCMRWCWSTVSQDDADDCARRQAIECAFNPLIPDVPMPDEFHPNRISLYYNQAVTGTYTCPDGNLFSYTVAENTIAALTPGTANALAFALAQQRAKARRVCISDMNDPICVNTWATKQITANGPNVAVFPATDRWELVSGTVPPGMTLETGFTSDGIELEGIPTALGEYQFRVRVTISTPLSPGFGDFMEKVFTVKIVGIEQSSPLPDAPLGMPYSEQLSAAFSSNHELETWSITSGSLPDGLTISTAGLISGTPTGALAGYSFTVQAQFPIGSVTAVCSKPMSITVTTPVPQPFAYWKMEEASGTTREDSVANNDLLVAGGGAVNQITGKIDFGAECIGGGNPRLRLLNDTDFSYAGEGFTACGWFLLPTYAGFPAIADIFEINFEDGGGAPLGLYQFFAPEDSAPGPIGDVPFKIGWYHNSGADIISTTETFAFNQWHFFRVWYDPADQKLHLQINNGTKLSSATSFAQAAAARADINLRNSGNTVRIDEVGYWKQILTDAAGSALYNSGSGLRPPLP